MNCELLGWPDAGPTLALDHEHFAYAGKFRMSNTGKAVGRESGTAAGGTAGETGPGELLAAAAFNADRTDDRVCWIRYITVRTDRRGEGLGPELARFLVEAARTSERSANTVPDGGFDAVHIAVNNAYAFEAMYRAGFAFTGETTGLAELVLSTDASRTGTGYREGMSRYATRDAPDAEYATERANEEPPALE